MKPFIAEYVICPSCLPDETGLALSVEESVGDEVIRGRFHCPACGADYPIREGTAELGVPSEIGENPPGRYESPELLSSYLWSHYADVFGDPDAGTAYSEWSSLIGPSPGPALDAGCAVGRFTFELGRTGRPVIGIDNSKRFIRAARDLLTAGRMDFEVVLEGRLHTSRSFEVPNAWNRDGVEFIVADAQALPFRSGTFSTLASLNLVDKLPKPLAHLIEINRVSRRTSAQLLFSDPFSWSDEAAVPADWLGGLPEGEFAGRGLDNVESILQGIRGGLRWPWTIDGHGSVWWKIRNHSNHFELIRSCWVKASR